MEMKAVRVEDDDFESHAPTSARAEDDIIQDVNDPKYDNKPD